MNTNTWKIISSVTLLSSLALAGCSGGAEDAASSTSSAPAAQSSGRPDGGQDAGRGGQRMEGTFGLIAAISDQTMQVQGDDGQTAVTWTDDTSFTQQVSASADDLAVDLCVRGTGSEADDATVTATTLTVSEATDGECSSGRPSGGGEDRPTDMPSMDPSAMPSDMPSDMPSMDPSSMPSGGPSGGCGFISGQITAIDGNQVTIEDADGEQSTFQVSDDTTVSTTREASASDAKEGLCAQALGDPDDTGAVTATSISLTEATDGECSMMGGRP